ncbi:hypothetical protein QE152_g27494 [Popillia japonica]|uniref:Uncharacterized protein n=1 Tax=Popillia japonica TaxID=7064 RepID=A0AAW1JVK8_POPJA
MIAHSWDRVAKTTIQNSFKHGGFSNIDDIMPEEKMAFPEDISAVDFEKWLDIDENIEVAAATTEADILQNIQQPSTSSNDTFEQLNYDDEEIEKPPTDHEMRCALNILRRGVQSRADTFKIQYEYENFIYDLLQRGYRQSSV